MRHGRRDDARRDGGAALPGILIAVAFTLAGITGYVVGNATSTPAADAAAPTPAKPTISPSPVPSAVVPTPTPTPSPSSLPTQDMTMGEETLAEGQSGRSETNLNSSDVEVLNWVETDDPVFFITIDDGLEQSPEVLEVIDRYQIPVTAFLTEYAVREHTDYFEAVTAYGGSIQNHTMVHGALNDPETDVEWEICETQDRFEEQFGSRPWMLRPPYGAGPKEPDVLAYSEQCGINRIVLWNVLVTNDNEVEYWDPPIRAGDIVLFHFVDGLEVGLEKIIELGRAQGLTPAPLEDYI